VDTAPRSSERAPRVDPLPIDGLLIVDKPSGWTSHDVVGRMRRLTGVRRIGHAGTLDPLATGVLPLGVGRGTRVLEYATEADKEYVATIRLGESTDTYDADGRVTATGDWRTVTREALGHALARFLGDIEQQPPVYSAIKQGGVPLYKLARAGQAVQAPTRRVTVYAITLLGLSLPDLTLRVRCSKGTYIRSLAHDLGTLLGCGGHLTALRRTASGGFSIEQALALDGWEAALSSGGWPARVLPLDTPLLGLPAVILGEEAARRLHDGVPPLLLETAAAPGARCRAYGADGSFLAVLHRRADREGWRVEKLLAGVSGPL
jgi:tRNA pseudouridine55 synthase